MAARQLFKAHALNYSFHSVTVNKNQRSAKHTDTFNSGFSTLWGSAITHGANWFSRTAGQGIHNIKNRWLKFKGDHVHYTMAFTGSATPSCIIIGRIQTPHKIIKTSNTHCSLHTVKSPP